MENGTFLVHADAVTCVFVVSVYIPLAGPHLAPSKKGRGGVLHCLSGVKMAIFGRFLMKNGTFRCSWMLYVALLQSVCQYRLLFCIQHPHKRVEVF